MADLSKFAPPLSSAMPAAELSSQVIPTRTKALIDQVLVGRMSDATFGRGRIKYMNEK